MIDFEHVSKQYKHNAKPALEDVNFHVDDGEFVFLLGHSGAGKSTLLKLILREETPTEGRVLVNGQDVARLRRRGLCNGAGRRNRIKQTGRRAGDDPARRPVV